MDYQLVDPSQGLYRRRSWHSFHMINAQISRSYIVQILSIFIPIGIAAGYLNVSNQLVFFFNLLALIPLIAWISLSITELSGSVGARVEELLKATLGNPIEVIVGIIAMHRGEVQLAQSVLIGSTLCYLLLTLGGCFFASGFGKKRLTFDRTLISTLSSLLMVVCVVSIIPTAVATFSAAAVSDILPISRITAAALTILLVVFLVFQLKTHASLFGLTITANETNTSARTSFLTISRAVLILLVTTACVTFCSIHLVNTIDGFASAIGVHKAILAQVLIPLLGNSTKYIAIIIISRVNQLDMGIKALITSVVRMMLTITPGLVLLGWIYELPTTLIFDAFEATVFFISLMVMNSMIHSGKTNYFEGLMLIAT
ncbi:hypothetical protein ASPWEDRAFT_36471 [Aspergillus wentii DTO 134E9]|uniref:Sodium/calcium exchanger membrane region domain-containing protein n=1 Tax=Aspergillus wentii DTO 134E9 TaxID=1073089 RepID=A0A1L9RVB1_ASPWE|nr:uncharacterized protein ASPWEDRAFT_36471 [Aspergillus wentii DTO 134E9]KAI9928708.1 hypothetical protein MW887_001925 [Aspergillus wentii]OJJ38798.1 hypothetical protein ASPWEDRAFT_36471 [Aspergillus wentii DTO 134E9]